MVEEASKRSNCCCRSSRESVSLSPMPCHDWSANASSTREEKQPAFPGEARGARVWMGSGSDALSTPNSLFAPEGEKLRLEPQGAGCVGPALGRNSKKPAKESSVRVLSDELIRACSGSCLSLSLLLACGGGRRFEASWHVFTVFPSLPHKRGRVPILALAVLGLGRLFAGICQP